MTTHSYTFRISAALALVATACGGPSDPDRSTRGSSDPTSSGGGASVGGDLANDGRPLATGGSDAGSEPMLGGGSSTGGALVSSGGSGTGGMLLSDTLRVQGRHLMDRCGEKLILKGVNHMAMYKDRAGEGISEIAKTGANTVRIMWFATKGVAISGAEDLVQKTIEAGMIPILEMHDATGPANWGQLAHIIDYWTSKEAVNFVAKHQKNFILNIANEAGPKKGDGFDDFELKYKDAISRIREAGILVPLMIDASSFGREQNVLFAKGKALLDHDPLHNVLFSWHAYDALDKAALTNVLEKAVDMELPFVVGEFANRSPTGSGCGSPLQYLHLIHEANRLDVGWLAWSWGLNPADQYANADCWEFDMSDTLAYSTLERWGLEVAVTDKDSLQNTALRPAPSCL